MQIRKARIVEEWQSSSISHSCKSKCKMDSTRGTRG